MLTTPGWNICPDLSCCSLAPPPASRGFILVAKVSQPEREDRSPPTAPAWGAIRPSSPWRLSMCHLLVSAVFKDNNSSRELFESAVGTDPYRPSALLPNLRGAFVYSSGTGRLETDPLNVSSLASSRRQQRLVQRHRRPGHHHASDHPKRRKLARLPIPLTPSPSLSRFHSAPPTSLSPSGSWPAPSLARGARGSSRSATSAGRPSRSTSH